MSGQGKQSGVGRAGREAAQGGCEGRGVGGDMKTVVEDKLTPADSMSQRTNGPLKAGREPLCA